MSNAAVAMSAIRVVLAGIPRLTADLVRHGIEEHPDLALVGDVGDVAELDGVTRRGVDVLVTSRTIHGVPTSCQQMLFADSDVPVIVIDPGGQLEVYGRRDVREATVDDLVSEIRRLAARAGGQRSANDTSSA